MNEQIQELQAEQEPVAWLADGQLFYTKDVASIEPLIPLFTAALVRTKDLTDDEAQKLWHDTSSIVPIWARHLHFARAVITADREKNK